MTIQVKICGLTNPDEAKACVEAGADAIGLIFFPLSPRHVEISQAQEIRKVVPAHVKLVGVFVDQSVESVIATVRQVGIDIVQLHGNESVMLIRILEESGIPTIKVLRTTGMSLLTEATEYNVARSILVEAGKGPLPGGNGVTWNWSEAKALADNRPYILAGGLKLENLSQALAESHASAVDLSSSVEHSPGQKNIEAVKAVIAEVKNFKPTYKTGKCFL